MSGKTISDEQFQREVLIIKIWQLRKHWPKNFLEDLEAGRIPKIRKNHHRPEGDNEDLHTK